MKKSLSFMVGCATLLVVCGSQARAQSVTLSSLLSPGATITSGDKVFSGFSYLVNPVSSPDMPTAASIFVTPEIVAGNYGLLFNALWHANPGNGTETAFLSYTVTVTAPNTFITDVHLDGDPIVNGGNGSASVTEQVSDTITHTAATARPLSIFDIATNGGATHSTRQNDVLNLLAPLTAVNISKTFSASADGPSSTPQITHTDQTFSQTAPEPGSLALLAGVGAPVFGLLLRRRRRASCV